MVNRYFTDPEHGEILENARNFFQKAFSSFENEGEDQRIRDLLNRLSSNGYHTLTIPEEQGGLAMDLRSSCGVLSELARANPALCQILGSHLFGFCNPLSRFGNEEQKERFLSSVTEKKLWGTLAITEPDGANPREMRCTATPTEGGYLLNGTKSMVTNAPHCHYVLILARTSKGDDLFSSFTLLIVSLTDKGETVSLGRRERTMGVHDCPISEISFNECPVDSGNVLGEEGGGLPLLLKILQETRLANAAYSMGIAEQSILEAARYASGRNVGGGPLIKERSASLSLAEMYASLEMMRFHFWGNLSNFDNKIYRTDPERLLHSSILKHKTTETALEICDRAMQMHGGNGYLKDYPIHRLYIAGRLGKIVGGTTEMLLSYISLRTEEILAGSDAPSAEKN